MKTFILTLVLYSSILFSNDFTYEKTIEILNNDTILPLESYSKVYHFGNNKLLTGLFKHYGKELLTPILKCYDSSNKLLWTYEKNTGYHMTIENIQLIDNLYILEGEWIRFKNSAGTLDYRPFKITLDLEGKEQSFLIDTSNILNFRALTPTIEVISNDSIFSLFTYKQKSKFNTYATVYSKNFKILGQNLIDSTKHINQNYIVNSYEFMDKKLILFSDMRNEFEGVVVNYKLVEFNRNKLSDIIYKLDDNNYPNRVIVSTKFINNFLYSCFYQKNESNIKQYYLHSYNLLTKDTSSMKIKNFNKFSNFEILSSDNNLVLLKEQILSNSDELFSMYYFINQNLEIKNKLLFDSSIDSLDFNSYLFYTINEIQKDKLFVGITNEKYSLKLFEFKINNLSILGNDKLEQTEKQIISNQLFLSQDLIGNSFTIYDLDGRIIMKDIVTDATISIQSLNKGTYLFTTDKKNILFFKE